MDIRARTPLLLQEELVKEMGKITEGMQFVKPKDKGKRVPLNIFPQSLPIPRGGSLTPVIQECETIDYMDEEMNEPVFNCPWCVVKIGTGEIPGINEMQNVNVAVCFGIFDDDTRNQGHQDILNLIQKTYERFAVNPILAGQYTCTGSFEWALQEEDTFPYFFGAIGTEFKFQGYRREIKY